METAETGGELEQATGTLAELEARCAELGWEVSWDEGHGCLLFYGWHDGRDWPSVASSGRADPRAALASCMNEAFEALEMVA